MTWNPDIGATYWAKPHGSPGGPGQKMSAASAEAMMRDCLACGAQSGERCIRVHDGGYTFQKDGQRLGRAHFETRPGQSHKVRFSRACREEAHGRPCHWTDDLDNCITCNPPPVPGTYYEDAPPASRSMNCAEWVAIRRQNPKAASKICSNAVPCACGAGDCCNCGWPVTAHTGA